MTEQPLNVPTAEMIGNTNTPAHRALENIRLFAQRHRREEWAQTVLRFCIEGGAAPRTLRDLRAELAEDGASAPSTMSLTVYVVPSPPAVCEGCHRGPKYYEGCSMVECPQRRPLTAAQGART